MYDKFIIRSTELQKVKITKNGLSEYEVFLNFKSLKNNGFGNEKIEINEYNNILNEPDIDTYKHDKISLRL